jgi:transcriptional adapter 1
VNKRRRKNDEIVFQAHPIHEFVKPIDSDPTRSSSIRYIAQELFLPDNSLIYGRFLAGCWENGLDFVDDQAIEMIVMGVQVMLKNIVSHCIRQRKNYRVTSDKKFYYDIGCEHKSLDIRNTITRQKVDSEIPPVERKAQDDSIFLSAHEESSYLRRKISLLDIYKTLRDKNVIPSHSISMLSIERLTTLVNL